MDKDSEGTQDDSPVIQINQWTSVDKIADRMGVTPRTVYRWLKSGRVKSRQVGDTTEYRLCPDTGTDTAETNTITSSDSTEGQISDSVTDQIIELLSAQIQIAQEDLRSAHETIAQQSRTIGALQKEIEILRKRQTPNALGRLKRALDILLGRA